MAKNSTSSSNLGGSFDERRCKEPQPSQNIFGLQGILYYREKKELHHSEADIMTQNT